MIKLSKGMRKTAIKARELNKMLVWLTYREGWKKSEVHVPK